ncbi:MAG: isopentenyl-diphosphate Delta-isomerase [Sphingobacteriia bacterium]|nr:isopentenyl-diphosphate Delta-isomerase [Sphingobacteriia bacterium]
MNMEEVILVDEKDNVVGYMEKMEAHEKAVLHRAFSVFIFNSRGEMLLQQRALKKYHSGGLWTNACCSHPRKDETTLRGAERRLKEEMGIVTPLKKIFDFIYKAEFDNGLSEYEFDHVYVGYSDERPDINLKEVANYTYRSMDFIDQFLNEHPDFYTAWFLLAFPKVLEWYHKSHPVKF